MKKTLSIFFKKDNRQSADRRIFFIVLQIFFTGSFIFLWEKAVVRFQLPKYILPKPSEIGDYLYKEFFSSHYAGYENILVKSTSSLFDALIGFLISVFFGSFFGVTFAYRPWIKRAFFPMVFFTQLLPVPAFAPVVAAVFGYGITTKIIIIVLFTIFPVIIGIEKAVRNISDSQSKLFRSYNSSKTSRMFQLVIPSIIPALFVNLKILVTASFVASIISELSVTVSHGIGKDIYTSFNNQIIPRVWSSLFVISLISVVLFIIVSRFEDYVFRKFHYGKSE